MSLEFQPEIKKINYDVKTILRKNNDGSFTVDQFTYKNQHLLFNHKVEISLELASKIAKELNNG